MEIKLAEADAIESLLSASEYEQTGRLKLKAIRAGALGQPLGNQPNNAPPEGCIPGFARLFRTACVVCRGDTCSEWRNQCLGTNATTPVTVLAPGGGRRLRRPRRSTSPRSATNPTMARNSAAEERAAVAALPYGSALLIAHSGPNQGARFLLDRTSRRPAATRRPTCSLTTSRFRASTHNSSARARSFTVVDSGSLNGTYVNNDRVDSVQLSPAPRCRSENSA